MRMLNLKTTSQVTLFALGTALFASSVQAAIFVKPHVTATDIFNTDKVNAASKGTLETLQISERMTDTRPILVAKKYFVSKAKRRDARAPQRGLAISPSSAKGDGYPTPGRAFEACGGAGNVFVMYDIGPDGQTSNHSFHCVD